MADVHVLRRDPLPSDNETEGIKVGDVVINLLTGTQWYMRTPGGNWVQIPNPS